MRRLFRVVVKYPTAFANDFGTTSGFVYANDVQEIERLMKERFTDKAEVTHAEFVQEGRLFL